MMLTDKILKRLGISNKCSVAYETGTQDGRRVAKWARLFNEVHTIEINAGLFIEASKRLDRRRHVHCYLGSSPDVLERIIDPKKRSFFFLDAHTVAPLDDPPDSLQCPLRDELRVIFAARWKKPPEILIDDARMFDRNGMFWFRNRRHSHGYDIRQFPSPEEILGTAISFSNRYKLTRTNGAFVLSTTWTGGVK